MICNLLRMQVVWKTDTAVMLSSYRREETNFFVFGNVGEFCLQTAVIQSLNFTSEILNSRDHF